MVTPLQGNTNGARGAEGGNNANGTSVANGNGDKYDSDDFNSKQDDTESDIPGYTLTFEDLQMQKVYEDWVHVNDINNLDGIIANKRSSKTSATTSQSCP